MLVPAYVAATRAYERQRDHEQGLNSEKRNCRLRVARDPA
jgi:hypothetical protein